MTMTCTTNTKFTAKTRSWTNVFAWVRLAAATSSQRRALKGLDLTRLEDLGLSVDEARVEANRPFWDVPGYWQR